MTDPKHTVEYLLGEMNVKLDKLMEAQGSTGEQLGRLDARVTSLESWRTTAKGYWAGGTLVVGSVVGILRYLGM